MGLSLAIMIRAFVSLRDQKQHGGTQEQGRTGTNVYKTSSYVILMLAFVLGEMLEKSVRQSLIVSQGSPLIFFTRPISLVLILVALFMILSPVFTRLLKARRLATVISQVREASSEDD
jgi:hypothetical protein